MSEDSEDYKLKTAIDVLLGIENPLLRSDFFVNKEDIPSWDRYSESAFDYNKKREEIVKEKISEYLYERLK